MESDLWLNLDADLGHGGPRRSSPNWLNACSLSQASTLWQSPPSYQVKWEIPPSGGSLASQGFATLVVLFFRDAGQDHMRDNERSAPTPGLPEGSGDGRCVCRLPVTRRGA